MTNKTPAPNRDASDRHSRAAALVMLLLMLAGSIQMLLALGKVDRQKIPMASTDFWQGRTTNTLEKQLDQQLPARDFLIGFANTLRFMLTHGANEQVRIGRHGWLFLTDELRYYDDAEKNIIKRVEIMHAVSEKLARDGVKLIIVLVPDKSRIMSEHLPERELPAWQREHYTIALQGLRQRGVAAVDLVRAFTVTNPAKVPLFYRTDTHWNQRGAQLAAQTIATTIKAMQPGLEPTSFRTVDSGGKQERVGDLLRLMGLQYTPNYLRPRPDIELPQTTLQTSSDAPLGLLDDASVPVALAGTSFSLRGNFHGYLQHALSAKILNIAIDGGGFSQAMRTYLQDESYQNAKPKIVIWEVPERVLPVAVGDDEGLF